MLGAGDGRSGRAPPARPAESSALRRAMLHDVLVTKLAPPPLPRRVVPRAALLARLAEALEHRLTLVHAGTGYGKTTALAALADLPAELFWYSVGEDDADPAVFLAHLVGAFRLRLPGALGAPLALLQEQAGRPDLWARALDALINALAAALPGPAILVVDDYHAVAGAPEIDALMRRLVGHLPPDLHVVLSARHPPAWPELVRWRARGELCEIGREALAFQPAEIETLFRSAYGVQLAPDDLQALAAKSEGWPIALQLVWQGLRQRSGASVAELLARGPGALAALFDYLAEDVLARQPPAVAAFLLQTAVLRELTPDACDALAGPGADSAALLEHLRARDLFVVALGPRRYRYQQLFHDFLRQLAAADPAAVRAGHLRAAAFFLARQDDAEAIFHWLAAGEHAAAAAAIGLAAETALGAGRLDTLAQWIAALPPGLLAEHPRLLACQGDLCRLHSRFAEALAWYAQAEHAWRRSGDSAGVSRALRGQALVYLDTVRPAEAEHLLAEALRLSDRAPDRAARARLLELQAENRLNMGRPDQAEALRAEARALREDGPGEDVLGVRVKLRTGRLDEAQRVLEGWAGDERRQVEQGRLHPPRSHRETLLILALIQALRGDAARAEALARQGEALGERLGSPFVCAVAQARLGHAAQLRRGPEPLAARGPDEALRCYRAAVALGDRLAVRRIRAEAMWGMTRAYGFFGDLAAAAAAAAEGCEIGRWAGDAWIVALIELTLGASHLLAGQPDAALPLLARALAAAHACGDQLGRAAARLWQSLAYHELRDEQRFALCAAEALELCEAHGYDFLWAAPSLLGPPDPRRLAPLLLAARARRIRPAYVAQLLGGLGLAELQLHPGYQLRICTLGAFRAWRGDAEIEPRDWQRDKARQLLLLLLTERARPLQRDEIVERLWPSLAPAAATRDFKVALNVLYKVLEPARGPEAPSAFVVRDGALYRLRPEADLWLDTAVFERECAAGLRLLERGAPDRAIERLQAAARLYAGDYLPEAIYEDWASAERERLRGLYQRAADALAGALVERGRYDEALEQCQRLLACDPCWEQAHRLIMRCYARQGNRPQALRAYQRCAAALRDELGVEPSPETSALYQRIAQGQTGAEP